MVWIYAQQLALIAFATVLLQAAGSGAAFETTVTLGLQVLVLFYVVGALLGEMARRVVEDSVTAEFRQTAAATSSSPTASPPTP